MSCWTEYIRESTQGITQVTAVAQICALYMGPLTQDLPKKAGCCSQQNFHIEQLQKGTHSLGASH